MNGTKLLLTMGPGLQPTRYGDVIVIDWERKKVIDKYRYSHRIHQENEKGLEGACWYGSQLLVTSECEVLEFSVAPLRLREARSFPFLNDAHAVAARDNQIWICNSGTDSVEEMDGRWEVLKTHDLLGSPWRRLRYSPRAIRSSLRKVYGRIRGWEKPYAHLPNRPKFVTLHKLLRSNAYRRIDRDLRFSYLRPHVVHPNHITFVGDDIWVTLFASGEVISLRTGRILTNGLGRPHDGVVAGNRFYITDCISNRLTVFELDLTVPCLGEKLAEKQLTQSPSEGFLRGVLVRDGRVYVGLTARRNASKQFQHARVVELDYDTLEPVEEWIVPTEFGKKIYSLLDATNSYHNSSTDK